jgi:translation initiation factor 4A
MSDQMNDNMNNNNNNDNNEDVYVNDSSIVPYENFDDMGLGIKLLRGVYNYGFEKPSPIQQRAIVAIQSKKDIIGQSQSGTGKTGAFSIGILNMIDEKLRSPQAIVLAPTRELAQQIFHVFNAISKSTKIVNSLCVGGLHTESNLETSHVIIGTPGRVLDLLKRRIIRNGHIKIFTLDEADEMLSKGFKEQIYEIFQCLSKDVQVLLFSATIPNEIMDITKLFMRSPLHILVKKERLTLEGIKQYYVNVEREEWKFDTLLDLYKTFEVTQSVCFCNSKQKVEMLSQRLIDANYSVSGIHSDITNRNEIMNEFRNGTTRILVTTDLLSRGIDIQHISIVINYDLPKSKETYIHRIGRSGRYGRKGVAINFVTNNDVNVIHDLEKFYNTEISEMPSNLKIN